jgi:hypothetical protein
MMKRIQSRLLFGTILVYFFFFLVSSLVTINDSKLPFFIAYILVLIVIVHTSAFVLRRYERGRAWARWGVFVLLYGSLLMFVRDAILLVSTLAGGRTGKGSAVAFVFDFIFIGAVVTAIVFMHTDRRDASLRHTKSVSVTKPNDVVQETGVPEVTMENGGGTNRSR